MFAPKCSTDVHKKIPCIYILIKANKYSTRIKFMEIYCYIPLNSDRKIDPGGKLNILGGGLSNVGK